MTNPGGGSKKGGERLVSLEELLSATIAVMMLVNNPSQIKAGSFWLKAAF